MMCWCHSRKSQSLSLDVLCTCDERPVFRFFFHATAGRKDDDEYNMEDEGEDMSDTEPEDASVQPEEAPVEVKAESPLIKEEEVDPALADWFTVDANDADPEVQVKQESDSETEPDSENEDVKREESDVKLEDDDDWSAIGAEVSVFA